MHAAIGVMGDYRSSFPIAMGKRYEFSIKTLLVGIKKGDLWNDVCLRKYLFFGYNYVLFVETHAESKQPFAFSSF